MDEEEKARRVQELYREALDLAEQAVLADKQKQYDVAVFLYNEAANIFNQIIDEDLESAEKIIQIQEKANEYVNRANYLTVKNLNNNNDYSMNTGSVSSVTDLPSLYHIVGSFTENNEASSSRPNNNNNDIINTSYNLDNSFNSGGDSFSYLNQPSGISNASPNTSINDSFIILNNNISKSNSNSPFTNNPSLSINTNSNTNNNSSITNSNNLTNSPTSVAPSAIKTSTTTSPPISASTTTNQNNSINNYNEEFNDMKYVHEESGCWNSENAGGSISNYSFYKNPQYKLNIHPTLGENGFLKVAAKTKDNLPVNIRLVGGGNRVSTVSKSDITSGAYRHGHCSFEILSIEPGDYTIIISTFHRNEEGDYSLTIGCSIPFSLTSIPPEGDGMLETVIDGQWIPGVTAMGCVHYNNYFKNPTYKITISEPTYILIRLQIQTLKPPGMHVAIFELQEDGTPGKEIASSGAYCNLIQGVLTNKIMLIPESEYVIIFSTWEPSPGPFTAFIYTTNMIEIQEVSHD